MYGVCATRNMLLQKKLPSSNYMYLTSFSKILENVYEGCRQNFQQTGIISSHAGLEEFIIKDFYDCRKFLSREN